MLHYFISVGSRCRDSASALNCNEYFSFQRYVRCPNPTGASSKRSRSTTRLSFN